MAKAWLILSGKGGVGKTLITASLATALSSRKERVCAIDAVTGMRDLDMMLGLEDRIVYDMLDVIRGDCTMDEALVSPPDLPRLSLLPAAQFARSSEVEAKAFAKLVRKLKSRFDHVLIDCPAGLEDNLRALVSDEITDCIVIATTDDMCIRSAERAVAALADCGVTYPHLIVNRLDAALIVSGEMYTAATVAQTLDLPLLGEIPEDPPLRRAVLGHKNPLQIDCEGRNALCRIAQRMLGEDVPLPAVGGTKPSLFRRPHLKPLKEVRAD